jgi:hypothetical protein
MKLMSFLSNVRSDVCYAFRGLKCAPGYTFTLILTLSLGLGAATTMVAIVNSVLLQPVALPQPEQLVLFVREVHGKRKTALGSTKFER